jgi:hypothetical protein
VSGCDGDYVLIHMYQCKGSSNQSCSKLRLPLGSSSRSFGRNMIMASLDGQAKALLAEGKTPRTQTRWNGGKLKIVKDKRMKVLER